MALNNGRGLTPFDIHVDGENTIYPISYPMRLLYSCTARLCGCQGDRSRAELTSTIMKHASVCLDVLQPLRCQMSEFVEFMVCVTAR